MPEEEMRILQINSIDLIVLPNEFDGNVKDRGPPDTTPARCFRLNLWFEIVIYILQENEPFSTENELIS